MTSKIQHDAASGKFFAVLGSDEAVLHYSREGDVIDMQSVFVPPAFRGQGMGARLAKAAFEYAKNENYRVIPTCPFIAGDFLDRFPQYRSLLLS